MDATRVMESADVGFALTPSPGLGELAPNFAANSGVRMAQRCVAIRRAWELIESEADDKVWVEYDAPALLWSERGRVLGRTLVMSTSAMIVHAPEADLSGRVRVLVQERQSAPALSLVADAERVVLDADLAVWRIQLRSLPAALELGLVRAVTRLLGKARRQMVPNSLLG